MSTHNCPVVRIQKSPHPNADALSIMEVMGYEVCLRTEDWEDGQLAVYVPPDYFVPDTPLFDWLKNTGSTVWQRIRTKKFRGRYSFGIMVPAPDGLQEGDNAMEPLGITRWVPPVPDGDSGNITGPPVYCPTYDLENIQPVIDLLEGSQVIIHEKLHGASARYLYHDGKMWIGSRTKWKDPAYSSPWRRALDACPGIEHWCRRNPGSALYGEVFGAVQSLKYGADRGQVFFAAFDVFDHDEFLDYSDARDSVGDYTMWAPELYWGPFNMDVVKELALDDSSWYTAKHMSEGVVVRPVKERYDPSVGRVILKYVSPRYLEKSKD